MPAQNIWVAKTPKSWVEFEPKVKYAWMPLKTSCQSSFAHRAIFVIGAFRSLDDEFVIVIPLTFWLISLSLQFYFWPRNTLAAAVSYNTWFYLSQNLSCIGKCKRFAYQMPGVRLWYFWRQCWMRHCWELRRRRDQMTIYFWSWLLLVVARPSPRPPRSFSPNSPLFWKQRPSADPEGVWTLQKWLFHLGPHHHQSDHRGRLLR